MVQTSGKILIASSSTIVGVMKSHARALSDKPRTRRTKPGCRGTAPYVIRDEALKSFMASAGPDAPRSSASEQSPGIAEKNGLERERTALQAAILELLALFLEDGFPIFHQPVERFLRSPLVGDHVVMHALLLGLQELRVGGLGPEVDHHAHRRQELLGQPSPVREARAAQYGLGARIAAQRPPLLLHIVAREPFDVLQRFTLVLGIGNHGDSLSAELGCPGGGGGIRKEAELAT